MESGYDVLGVDRRPERVRDLAESISKAVQGEATDPGLWKDLPVKGAEVGVVAFSSSVESNVFTALLLRKAGVRQVVARSQNDLHSELLRAIGVDHIVEPELESALRLAHILGTHIEDYLEVTQDFGIARITANSRLKGSTVLKLHQEKKVTVLAVRRGNRVILEPRDNEKIADGDTLVFAGKDEDLRELPYI
jgi:trk system potassium uptake protein TrkA